MNRTKDMHIIGLDLETRGIIYKVKEERGFKSIAQAVKFIVDAYKNRFCCKNGSYQLRKVGVA